MGDQFEHCQLPPAQGLAATAWGAWQRWQMPQQVDLHRAAGPGQQLLLQPLRVPLQQRLERLQHAPACGLQQAGQQLRGLAIAAFVQQQQHPLAERADGEHHAAAGLAALDQPGQALERLCAA